MIFAPYTVVVKTLLLPGLTALLLATLTVVPAAVHILDWQGAGAAYDSAASEARGVSSELADAEAELEAARDAATLALADATAVASAGTGYLAAGAVAELTSANAELQEALDADEVEGAAMPSAERPGSAAGLRDRATALLDWAVVESTRADALAQQAEGFASLAATVEGATVAAAKSASTESASALAVAPIASAETKAALGAARDELISAAGNGALADYVTAYSAAVEALFASQREQEAAAAEAETQETNSDDPYYSEEAIRQRLHEAMMDLMGYDDEDCVPITNGWMCY